MKKLALSTLLLVLLVSSTATISSAQTKMYPLTSSAGSASAAAKASLTAKETNLRTRADTEIQRRITSLNVLLNRVNTLKHVSAENKTTYSTEITTEVANLTQLKTKIDSDTDAATLKTDVQSIITSYRVFALFMPQLRLLAASDSIMDITDKLTSLATRFQTRIATLQSSGKDVTSLQTLLTDMQAKIADANTQATGISTEVSPLTPAGYPGNKTTLMDGRKKLQAAYLDLKTAGQDARQIIQGLLVLSGGTGTASGSAGLEVSPRTGSMTPANTLKPLKTVTSTAQDATGTTSGVQQ